MRQRRSFSTLIKSIEGKWSQQVLNARSGDGGEKFYVLAQFPYPSGSLHMGHVRVYTIADALARMKRLQGCRVLHPLGWDAFGLPAENAARERGIDPAHWTRTNIAQMKRQIMDLGIQIPWDEREINTSDAAYARWTRWLFARLFRKGFAYRAHAEVNWDPKDETVLADEQVSAEGRAWRSGALVQRRLLPQWFLKITAYAPELLAGLDTLPQWPHGVKEMQRNWIPQMRDWLVSRQRRWGTPIPILHCPSCGPVLTIDDQGNDLPNSNTECHQCGRKDDIQAETDTMDTFVDSSWYFLRFLDPHNSSLAFDPRQLSWMPVDVYVGGVEHSILHLLYARFIHKFLMDDLQAWGPREPFQRLLCQGLVMGRTFRCPDTHAYLKPNELTESPNRSMRSMVVKATGREALVSWEKMSKSKYNGVDPAQLLDVHGADCLRLAVLFKAPVESHLYWDEQDVVGISRWMHRILAMPVNRHPSPTSRRALARTRAQVLRDLGGKFQFHTAIAALMKLSNELDAIGGFDQECLEQFAVMLYPLAPHLASELYSKSGKEEDISNAAWPCTSIAASDNAGPGYLKVQLDGKVIGEVEYSHDDVDGASTIQAALQKFSLNTTYQGKLLKDKALLSFSSRLINKKNINCK